MSQILKFPLNQLQPSQLYISAEKLSRILQYFDPQELESLEPIPVKKLGDEIIYTDGHTRAFAAHQLGSGEIPVVWDEDELDWEAYEICVQWCREEGIHTIADLEGRILDQESYEILWLKRCQEMHATLEQERRKSSPSSI